MKHTHCQPGQRRRSIRIKEYDYSQPGAYFVTVCGKNRECLFGNIAHDQLVLNDCGKAVAAAWRDLMNHYPHIQLDSFVVMPNHVHGIVIIVGAGFKPALIEATKCYSLSEIIRAFKTFSSKHVNTLRKLQGIPVWQRNYYEHVIRNNDKLNLIREYIANNPLCWHFDRENPVPAPKI